VQRARNAISQHLLGAATAHGPMWRQLVWAGPLVRVSDLLRVFGGRIGADAWNIQPAAKSNPVRLTDTAANCAAPDDKLTQLSHQKDSFLKQISHELRTPPMDLFIRAFSEHFCADAEGLEAGRKDPLRVDLIHSEPFRLTRLLD